jgi:thymidylate synthase (FAD)
MLVKLLTYTPEPDKLVAAAAKLCYSDAHIETIMDGLTPEKTDAFLKKLSSMGHQSPTEHAYFTFGIEGVSRTLLAQITRHRIASFSVQSQRYVRLDDFRYVIPPVIENDPEAKATFIEAMNRDAENYLKEVERLEVIHTKVLMENGASEKDAKRMASKFANEDARFLLPNACETKMVVTMNARSLHNFFAMRCCNICDKEDSDNDTQQYILKNLNSLGNSVDFWGRKNDRQHVIDGMSAAQKSQLLCYILRNHEAFGKMTCRDWKNWLLDDAEPQFGIWF